VGAVLTASAADGTVSRKQRIKRLWQNITDETVLIPRTN